VDLVICGTVAVNRQGARVGKGGGFSDLEVAFLVEAGVIRPDTVLATTVHPLQVVDEPIPETIHDFRVDLIITPDEAIWCAEPHRPPGILWEHLDQDKIAEIPADELCIGQDELLALEAGQVVDHYWAEVLLAGERAVIDHGGVRGRRESNGHRYCQHQHRSAPHSSSDARHEPTPTVRP